MKKLFSLFFALILLFGCVENSQKIHSVNGLALGTTYKVLYVSENSYLNLQSSFDSIFKIMNQSLSTYIDDSDISKINKGLELIEVDEHFTNVFQKSKDIWNLTDGFFDPTIGIITKANKN